MNNTKDQAGFDKADNQRTKPMSPEEMKKVAGGSSDAVEDEVTREGEGSEPFL